MPCWIRSNRLLQAAKSGSLTPEILAEVETSFNDPEMHYLNREIPKAIDQSLEGLGRVAAIVRAMKEFSHPGNEQKQNVDLAHAIENALTISRNEWKYVANVVTDFDPHLPMVACLPGDLNQVILNLIVNAAQAIAEKNGTKPDRKEQLPSAPGKTAIGPKSTSKIPAPAFPKKSATASSILFSPPRNPAKAAAKDCPSHITSSRKNTAEQFNSKPKSDKAQRSSFVCPYRKIKK